MAWRNRILIGFSCLSRLSLRAACSLVILACLLLGLSSCTKKMTRPGGLFNIESFLRSEPRTPEVDQAEETPQPESSKERGIRLAKEKHLAEAIEAFKLHVEENPEDYFGFNAIAVCYKQMGNPHQAMTNFQRALEFTESPEDKAKVLANIGNVYFAAKKYQAALGYYKEAAAGFEENPLHLIQIARTFIVLDEFDRARKVLASVEPIAGRVSEYEGEEDKGLAYYLLATCYVALGEQENALKYTERALEAAPYRFVRRLESDMADEGSLFYTLKDDRDLKRMLAEHYAETSPLLWLLH